MLLRKKLFVQVLVVSFLAQNISGVGFGLEGEEPSEISIEPDHWAIPFVDIVFEKFTTAVNKEATKLAGMAKANGIDEFQNCVLIVAAGLATWGAQLGGPIGAAVGAGAGIPAAQLGCKSVGFKS